jgi:hypothetical protein
MKNPIQNFIVAAVFAVSVGLNMLVLERAGSLANYVLLYGLSGRFSLSGVLTLFAGCIGVVGFLSAFALHRSILSTATVRKNLTVVSMYMNGIAIVAILAMAVFPTVHFR